MVWFAPQIRFLGTGTHSDGEGPAGSKVPHLFAGGPLTQIAARHVPKGVADMATGKVKWFNDQKGFGFISSDNGAKDIFVHHSVIEGEGFRTLQDGESVEYEAEDGPKGMKATRVKRTAPVPAH